MNNFGELTDSENVMLNKKRLLKLQDSTSLVIGLGAGILQLESLEGFYLFIGSYMSIGLLFILCICQSRPQKFYQSPIQDIFLESFFRELTGFIMAWTFSYALVG